MNENATPKRSKSTPAERWVKRCFLLTILLAGIIVGYIQLRGPMLGWPDDMDSALSKAKAEDRAVVVFVRSFPVSATGKRMVLTTLSKSGNKKALENGKFLLVEIRLKRSAGWANKYGVTKTPTMLLIATDGEKFHKAEGMIGETEFRNEFLNALTDGT
ncbi:MAG: hypothetical protein K8R91_03345 [Phycisphaerae bacterium]|nr:hypothetical protein [Phycisphaerae bacterium]